MIKQIYFKQFNLAQVEVKWFQMLSAHTIKKVYVGL